MSTTQRIKRDKRAAEKAGLEVRHDAMGYYVCTIEDDGHMSVGFDGRNHWLDINDAWDGARRMAQTTGGNS